jgi:ankyrin repeat protein
MQNNFELSDELEDQGIDLEDIINDLIEEEFRLEVQSECDKELREYVLANYSIKSKQYKKRSLIDKLFTATEGYYIEEVKRLIDDGADVNAVDNKGYTALMIAVLGNHLEIVEILIKAGANVNARSKWGDTALMFAALAGNNIDMIGLLIKAGADVNAKNDLNGTALRNATYFHFYEIVEILKSCGAKE